MSKDSIQIADHFYTIQGEGVTAGKPAYFLRTQGCNFQCGAPDWNEVEDRSDYDSVKEAESSDASWTCDTMHESEGGWMTGEEYSFQELEQEMEEEQGDVFDRLQNQEAHLVITGGEPLLRQDELAGFLEYIDGEKMYIEVETNASIKPEEELDQFVDQYNTSPKLSNSGMPEEKRIDQEAIEFFRDRENAYFKFVTGNKEDTREIMSEWVERFDLDSSDILLMPAGASQEELQNRKREVAELAKEYGLRYSERVHISIWDEMVSV